MADSSGTHLYLVLMKAHRTMARHAHRSIAAHHLGFSDFTSLEALLHKGPMLVNEIGRRIELTSGSLTTAVDRLEARGLVERSADANDRRAKQVSLTRSGRTLITHLQNGYGGRTPIASPKGRSSRYVNVLAFAAPSLGPVASQRVGFQVRSRPRAIREAAD